MVRLVLEPDWHVSSNGFVSGFFKKHTTPPTIGVATTKSSTILIFLTYYTLLTPQYSIDKA